MFSAVTDLKLFPDFAITVTKGKSEIILADDEAWPDVYGLYVSILEKHCPENTIDVKDPSVEWNDERWRCHIFHCDKGWCCALRKNPSVIPSLEHDLGFKADDIVSLTKGTGLILIAGSTGSGKTTTMSALLNHLSINNELGDTVTIEQPIEYVHNNPLISQREVGVDVASFHNGIHEAVRQFPKNIVIGEIRHPDTAEAAVQMGLTGHRVFATIHAETAPEACSRMFALLDSQHDELFPQALQGIICQHLIHSVTGNKGFIYETVLATSSLKSLLVQGPDALKRIYHEMYTQNRKTLTQQAEHLSAMGIVLPEEVTRWVKK